MSDLISREYMKSLGGDCIARRLKDGDLCPIISIDLLPSVQPERKRGEWIYGENDGQDGWYCSECGLFIPWYYDYYGLDNIDFIADFNTCPKCDTKMLKYTGMRGDSE